MITNGLDLIEALMQHFLSDPQLSHVIITKQLFGKQPFPAFSTHCLILSPIAPRFDLKTLRMMQETFSFEIVCVVKNIDPVESVWGPLGIISTIYETWKSTIQFVLKNRHYGVDATLGEINENIRIDEQFENDIFYFTVKIPVKIKLKEFEVKEA